jgi:Fe-S-cluster containining protein
MKKSRGEELMDEIDNWLDAHSEVFNEIKKDWEEYKMVQAVDSPVQEFTCNDCGKCCCFSAEVFPADITCWFDEMRFDILCALFPYNDENEEIIYGIPTQNDFHERINEILEDKSIQEVEKKAFTKIRDVVKAINPGYDSSSQYCIFYNPKEKKHCMIYDTRPFSCQVYPYELSMFTRTVIPQELSETYGYTEDFKELSTELPMCSNDCFSKKDPKLPTRCTEDDLYAVLLDKINFLEFSITESEEKEDIVSCLIESYASRIRFPKQNLIPSETKEIQKIHSLNNDSKIPKKTDSNQKSQEKDSENGQKIKMTFGPNDLNKNKNTLNNKKK